ncbi:Fic family protein [Hymenobacter jeollabukensis]|uniref:protein adenylyltransferase n=1 Tax=Hymenobacter jeollabukensis TaxID=2025313 RepID=A0A5R8WJ12_9BACT|nr:Fic family protein [Hymenobacter jeollabukensis]TLM88740.1 hypothetical protein FDY95_23185 [Hymenobacter jeollabukensis]
MTYFEEQRYGPVVPENKLKETAATDLQNFEARAGGFRRWEVEVGQVSIPGQFDAAHFKALHAHVMKDVYQWAGETRTDQNIERARVHEHNPKVYEDRIHYAPAEQVDKRLDEISEQLKRDNGLRGLGKEEFVAGAARYFDQINHVQPFRAGNEQTIMTAVALIGQEAGYKIDFDKVRGEELRKAGDQELARTSGEQQPALQGLRNVFSRITEPAEGREAELRRSPELASVAAPTLLEHQRGAERDFQQHGRRLGEEFAFQQVLGGHGREQALAVSKAQFEVERGRNLDENLPVLRSMADSLEKSGKVDMGELRDFRASMDRLQELEKPVKQEQAKEDFARYTPIVAGQLRDVNQHEDAATLERLQGIVQREGKLTGKDVDAFDQAIGKGNLLVADRTALDKLGKAGDVVAVQAGKSDRGNERSAGWDMER